MESPVIAYAEVWVMPTRGMLSLFRTGWPGVLSA